MTIEQKNKPNTESGYDPFSLLGILTIHMQLMHLSHNVLKTQMSMIESNLEKQKPKIFRELQQVNDALMEASGKMCEITTGCVKKNLTRQQIRESVSEIIDQYQQIADQAHKYIKTEVDMEHLRKWVT